ncbi:MAG: S28 family serine protease [Bacteroidales bacterium]|nr:S28 family serine protease [Bacteroidales bacterium]
MKKSFLLIYVMLSWTGAYSQSTDPQIALLESFLKNRSDVSFDTIAHHPHFAKAYVLKITQPVDHNNPDGATFTQRVFLFHRDFSRPVVFVTEGYGAGYAIYPRAINELTEYLDGNQIVVEHRYFGESVPNPLDWQYLDIEQAAADHHRVVELFKGLYRARWLNTGISKGGQTAIYHRYFHPDDVDASVGYVCPLNFSIQDARIYDFMQKVGSESCRNRIYQYQVEMLKNKSLYYPVYQKMAEEKKYTYKRTGIEKSYEMTILEYAFAFWQWGRWTCDSIPVPARSPGEMVKHLDMVAGIDWLSDQRIDRFLPFYYQAMTEIGFYGYDVDPFGDLVSASEDITFTFTCPEGVECEYDPLPMEEVDHFLRHDARRMLFIYGEYDPWSAPAVQPSGKNDVAVIFKPQGAHSSRIGNLPEDLQEKALELLGKWMGVMIEGREERGERRNREK